MAVKHLCNFRVTEEYSPSLNALLQAERYDSRWNLETLARQETANHLNKLSMQAEVETTRKRHAG